MRIASKYWWFFVWAVLGCILVVGFFLYKDGTSESLQHDLDIVRLNDLAQLSGYIEEYKDATGKYPMQGQTDLPHYVYVATKAQEQYAENGPPYAHKRSGVQLLVKELVSVLGDDIQIPFDLQKVPVNKPNFYIYMVKDESYYLAVHVHQNFPFSYPIADHNNKVEVTNYQGKTRKGTWLRSELMKDEAFTEAMNAEPIKPGYTQALRKKLGGNAAFQ